MSTLPLFWSLSSSLFDSFIHLFIYLCRVALITKAAGIAYVTNNIYFSSWFSLFACIYTLDKWSGAKDIISIRELTGVSATLKSWYVLFLSSLVAMGTCCDLMGHLSERYRGSAIAGVILSLISTLMALFFILVHYRIVDYEVLQVGGWVELSASFVMILLWLVAVAILTAEGGIAATLGGSGCTAEAEAKYDIDWETECVVVWLPTSVDMEDITVMPTLEPEGGSDSNVTEAPAASPSGPPPVGMTEAPAETTPSTTVSPSSYVPSLSGNETQESTLPGYSPSMPGNETQEGGVADGNATMDPTENLFESMAPSSLIDPEFDEADQTDVPASILDIDLVEGENFTATIQPSNVSSTFNRTDQNNTGQRMLQEMDVLFNTTTATNMTNATSQPSPKPIQSSAPSMSPPTPKPIPSIAPSMFPSSLPSIVPSTSPRDFWVSPIARRAACSDVIDQTIPGSNLYLSCWICFFAAVNITLRWKAAQALQFAQARHRKADERAGGATRRDDLDGSGSKNGDDVDDNERDPDGSDRGADDDLR
jgi:hypothetical protein